MKIEISISVIKQLGLNSYPSFNNHCSWNKNSIDDDTIVKMGIIHCPLHSVFTKSSAQLSSMKEFFICSENWV